MGKSWPRGPTWPDRSGGSGGSGSLFLLLRLRLFWREERRRLRRQPREQVLRFHEAPGIRPRAQNDDGDLLVALGEAQQRRQAVARLRDEARLPRQDIHVLTAEQMIRAVERDRAPRGAD